MNFCPIFSSLQWTDYLGGGQQNGKCKGMVSQLIFYMYPLSFMDSLVLSEITYGHCLCT